MPYTVGIDVGGTCTDCVVMDDLGRLTFAKAFSTPSEFSRGILDALQAAADALGMPRARLLAETALFLHSTTVAENAIVDGTLGSAGLLVTRGFEHTLYIMRGGYGRWAGLGEEDRKNVIETDKPAPLLPFSMIQAIRERTDSQGRVLAHPDEAEVEQALRALLAQGARAIGVCFLWSFRNPENEQIVRKVAERVAPGLFFTLSSDLVPVEGEYERTSTVALNVGLGPMVSQYLANLGDRLRAEGFRGSMLVMQAHGGLLRVDDVPARAVGLIESGPVGGLVGTKAIGDLLGIPNILATDMGGTTFKVGLVREGRFEYEREPMAVRYHYALNKLDIVSIGLAGGSIVSVEPRTGMPRLGPRSAGADPGPVCYGFGGREPTVTDVDLLLGYLDPRFFLGGRATLDREAARRVFKAGVADPLGMDVLEAAGAMYRLANSMMYDLLHKQTVEKGLDPRDYVLFVYGGTAGMHMAAIGAELGVKSLLVPNSASVHGAFGLVSADIAYEDVTSRSLPVPAEPRQVEEIFAALDRRVLERLQSAGFTREDIRVERSINMRYRRQIHVINTPLEGREVTAGALEQAYERFNQIYAERYGAGAGYREAGMEMVSFLLRGTARMKKFELKGEALAGPDPRKAYVETRTAYFPAAGMQEAKCYDFERLAPGNEVAGPAIIWTPITTVVVQPGQRAGCDRYKNIAVSW